MDKGINEALERTLKIRDQFGKIYFWQRLQWVQRSTKDKQ